jgi:hypothetical protein
MNEALKSLIELAAAASDMPIREDLSVEEQFPELVAPLMRYQMLLKNVTEDTIQGHINLNKSDLIKCKAVYTKDYLDSLPIPYEGIQRLCKELLNLCRQFEVKPTTIWENYADGVFDWGNDIEYMSSL